MACFLVAELRRAPLPESCCEEGPKEPLLVLLAPNGACRTFNFWSLVCTGGGWADLGRPAVGTRGFAHP